MSKENREDMVVVSVRFPESLIERIGAVSQIEGKTSQQVIREGMNWEVNRTANSEEFREASEEYVRRARQLAIIALGQELGAKAGEPGEEEELEEPEEAWV